MRLLCSIGSVAASAVLALAGSKSLGQNCQGYWSGFPVTEIPGYPNVTFAYLDTTEGPTLFAKNYLTGDDRLYRYTNTQWLEVSRKGMPPPIGIARINALDDGTGIHLYAQVYPGNISVDPPMRGYRLDGDVWTPMPEDFWRGQFHAPYLSADLGDGKRIYGRRPPHVCVWNEDAWQPLPLPEQTQLSVHLEVENDGGGFALYMFGGIWPLNGQTAYGFAKWDGSTYSIPFTDAADVNSYSSYPATCAVTFDDGTGLAMYSIRGPRYNQSSLNFPVLWRWRNNQWTVVGQPVGSPNAFTGARQICLFDDGRGMAIYVAGNFNNVNGIPCNSIARWDGQTWEPLGSGLTLATGDTTFMGVVHDASGSSLVVVGEGVYGAGGGTSRRGVKWVGCPNCYANCDLSTAFPKLTANDFMCFINKFAAKDPYANCDGGTSINAADFACFLNRYAAGCS